jgi:hypothetical protein
LSEEEYEETASIARDVDRGFDNRDSLHSL